MTQEVIRLAVVLLLLLPAAASAAPYLPDRGKIFHGLTAGESTADFTARTGKRPAVWQHFVIWGGRFEYPFQRSASSGARVMLGISTADGQNRPERISPGEIARGKGDGYLLWLNRRLAEHGDPAYIRLMGEMNNCDNAYAAYHCNGTRRDRDHSAHRFKLAWKRVVLIVKGGPVTRINARLRAIGLPRVEAGAGELPTPKVAFIWSPMTGGSPMIGGLDPSVYWPGRRWVDWVGTSFYSRYPNFHYLEPYYRRYAVGQRKPFAIAEWAMWGADSGPFARRLFRWIRTHKRVRMVQYNQGSEPSGPFRLKRYPQAQQVLKDVLRSPVFSSTG